MSDPRTSIASYSASGSLVIFGMTANDFGVLIGLVLAVCTFGINWYYKHRHLKIIEKKVNGMGLSEINKDEV